MSGKLITLEGISGMGKTYYFNLMKELNKDKDMIFNREITDENHKGTNKKIFDILMSSNSRFFDLGNPKMETLLIAAKQANDENQFIVPNIEKGKNVVSDRGFDTICIVEAVMFAKMYGGNSLKYAEEIYSWLKNFNKLPDATILLTGEYENAIKRAELRDNKKYSIEELKILKKTYILFQKFAEKYNDRFFIVNVDRGTQNTINEIKNVMKVILKK